MSRAGGEVPFLALKYILADYDATSRRHGASQCSPLWKKMLRDEAPGEQYTEFARQLGPATPFLVECATRDAAREGAVPLLLGGEHSLTWSTLRGLVSVHGPLQVVHFDAHHDAYESALLTHYTVFHHIERELPVTIHRVGIRHEGEAPPQLQTQIEGSTYISLDVDYFDPGFVSQVVHSVPTAHPPSYSLASLQATLQKIAGPLVGADLVEWMGAPEESSEFGFVRDALRLVLSRLREENP